MDVLRTGLGIAGKRLGLAFTLFVGEGVIGLVQLGGLLVVGAALLFGFFGALSTSADPAASALLPGVIRFLLQPRVILGAGGALVACGLLVFALGVLLRAGLLASLEQAVGPASRSFSLRTFFRGGMALLDRLAPLALLEGLAPCCGLAFAIPGLVAAWPALVGLTAGSGFPWSAVLVCSLALAGGALLALALHVWARLAMIEVALQPAQPLGRALADSALALAASLPRLLHLGLALLGLWGLAVAAYAIGLGLLGGLAEQASLVLVSSAGRTLLDLLFSLFAAFLAVAGWASLTLLYLRFRPGGSRQATGWPDGGAAPGTPRPGTPRPDAPEDEVEDESAAAEAEPRGAPPAGDELLEVVDPGNVFLIDDFLSSEPPAAGADRARADVPAAGADRARADVPAAGADRARADVPAAGAEPAEADPTAGGGVVQPAPPAPEVPRLPPEQDRPAPPGDGGTG